MYTNQQQQEAASDEAQQSRHDVTHPPCDSPSCLYHLILIRYSAHLQTMQIPRRATCGPISAPCFAGCREPARIYMSHTKLVARLLSDLQQPPAPGLFSLAVKGFDDDDAALFRSSIP
jgi:hypothetical protein